jgi:hypothetical protein
MAQGSYRVIEPTFQVTGGTPVEALERVLNDQAAEGYELFTAADVREVDGQWVHVLVLKRVATPPAA